MAVCSKADALDCTERRTGNRARWRVGSRGSEASVERTAAYKEVRWNDFCTRNEDGHSKCQLDNERREVEEIVVVRTFR